MTLQYDILPPRSIRLLELTGSDDQDIGFKLTTHAFDGAPAFNALSYVWGVQPEPPIYHVQCISEHSPAGAILPVASNLFGALKSIKNFSKLPIWIDAVCINQKDMAEKAVLVPFMDRIYSTAKQVLVWLGPETDNSYLAIDVLNGMSNLESLDPVTITTMLPPSLNLQQLSALRRILERGEAVEVSADAYRRMYLPDFHHSLWKALSRLYFREWLSRLWTFQEVMLATSAVVLCGNRSVSWAIFEKFGLALADTQLLYHTEHIHTLPSQRQTKSIPPFTRLNSFRRKHHNGEWFWHYITEARFKECGFPEDRIYALLGLAPQSVRRNIIVNYDQHYSAGYIQASKCFIKAFSSHSILSIASSIDKPAELPSWCPDYNAAPSTISVSPKSRAGSHLGDFKLFEEDPTNENIIRLGGVNADTISHVISDYLWYWPPNGVAGVDGPAARLLAWLDEVWVLTLQTIGDEEQARDAYWQALFGNIPGDNVEEFPSDPINGLDAFRIRLAENRASVPLPQTALTRDQLIVLSCVLAYLGKLWRERVFFSTAGGRLGFANRGVAKGDDLCVLFGQPQLYTLRKCSFNSDPKRYTFVSVAFVHGLMLGQGCLSVEPNDRQIFELC